MQNIINEWRKLNEKEKYNAISQLKELYVSEQIEKEITQENNIEPDKQDSHNTCHKIINKDFNSESTIDYIIQNKLCPNLIFTSPPYNAGIDYGNFDDKKTLDNYLGFLETFLTGCDKILKTGGRLAINIRDITIGSGSRYPIIVFLYNILCKKIGYTYRGLHIWYKGREESSLAWGSWMKSSNPSIIDLYEYVFIFQKGYYNSGIDDLEKTEFIESVLGVWKIRPVKKISGKTKKNTMNHPCPFPVELPKRVIKLYSHVGDTVLDPFAGICTTSLASAKIGRNSICIDINKEYCEEGYNRMKKECGGIFSDTKIESL
jgi:site-specific DNA-methyltransferase (adenine-specific)